MKVFNKFEREEHGPVFPKLKGYFYDILMMIIIMFIDQQNHN